MSEKNLKIEDVFKCTVQLCEAYSHTNPNYHFSLLDQDNKPLHSFFQCKDYYHDLIHVQLFGKSITIYGYQASKAVKKQFLLEPGMFNIGLRYGTYTKTGDKFTPHEGINAENLLRALNEMEAIFGFEKSGITPYEDFVIVHSSTDWLVLPFLSSLYFTMLRIGNKYTETNLLEFFKQVPSKSSGSDAGHIKNVMGTPNFIENLLNNQLEYCNFYTPTNISSHDIHNQYGMVHFSNSIRQKYVSSTISNYGALKLENKKTIQELIAYSKELHSTASTPELVAA